jgi:DNA-binding transcriptional LysR family regulator
METTPPERIAVTPNLHLQQLAYLREVALRGSMSAAAEALHVSQPALSQALAELARRLGVALFEKSGRGRRLTEAGRDVLRFAEETLTGAEALSRRLVSLRDGEAGTLTAGMIDAAGLYLLPDIVRRYRAAHPIVELKLVVDTSEALLRRLRAFELDLAFVVGPVEDADLAAVEVLREPLHIYAPTTGAGAIAEARWLLYPDGSRTRAIIDAAFAHAGINPAIALESGNPAVLRQMVALGMGWAVLPPAVAAEATDDAVLRREAQIAERSLCAVRRRDSPLDRRVEEFLRLTLGSGLGESAAPP